MMEIGVVKSIDGINAKVLISKPNSPCDHCTQQSCTIPGEGIETEALNRAGARIGQKVKVTMKPYTYVKGAFLVYILPVIALFGGAVVGKVYLPAYFSGIDSDLLAAVTGFAAFGASIPLLKGLLGRMSGEAKTVSVIEDVMED